MRNNELINNMRKKDRIISDMVAGKKLLQQSIKRTQENYTIVKETRECNGLQIAPQENKYINQGLMSYTFQTNEKSILEQLTRKQDDEKNQSKNEKNQD